MINHIFLLSIDALRFDCVSYQEDKRYLAKYGLDNQLYTPNLNEIFDKTVNFSYAIATSPYTTTSHASIFTGLNPPRHGVRAFMSPKSHSLKEGVKTLTEILREQGYQTILASDELFLFELTGIDRGFDHKFEQNDDQLLEFLHQHKQDKLFVFKHFFDVHDPYLLTPFEYEPEINEPLKDLLEKALKRRVAKTPRALYQAWRELYGGFKNSDKKLLPLYLEGINKFDEGRWNRFISGLKKMGAFEDAMTIILSDHGEGRCDRNNLSFFAHGGDLYDDLVRVPMSIYSPNHVSKTNNKLVSLIDVFNTVINQALGVNADDLVGYPLDGVDILNGNGHDITYAEMWRSDKEHPQDFLENDNWILCERMVRTKKHKLILKGQPEKIFESRESHNLAELINRSIRCHFDSSTLDKKKSVSQLLSLVLNEDNFHPTLFYDLGRDYWEERGVDLFKQVLSLQEKLLSKMLLSKLLRFEDKKNQQVKVDNGYLKYLQQLQDQTTAKSKMFDFLFKVYSRLL